VASIDGEHIRVTVSDAGRGFDPEEMWQRTSSVCACFGLFSIRERLEMLGGRMEIQSAPLKGSRFTLVAPTRGESKI
jgi:two-component system sensor histidine kinase DegS